MLNKYSHHARSPVPGNDNNSRQLRQTPKKNYIREKWQKHVKEKFEERSLPDLLHYSESRHLEARQMSSMSSYPDSMRNAIEDKVAERMQEVWTSYGSSIEWYEES